MTHESPEDCPDGLVRYFPRSAVFGLPIHDGGSAFVAIRYCPWRGADPVDCAPPRAGQDSSSDAEDD